MRISGHQGRTRSGWPRLEWPRRSSVVAPDFSVLTVLGGEFGARGRAGVLPALLPPGHRRDAVPALNTRERVQVENALG